MSGKTRTGGLMFGLALGGLPGTVLGVYFDWRNPAFLDAPLSFWALCIAVPGLLFGLVGLLVGARPHPGMRMTIASSLALPFLLSMHDGIAPIPETKLLVFGIDGAAWRHAEPMIAAGELPALATIARDGAHGTMRAEEPLFSPLLWTTMASGRLPDAHGIHGFHVTAPDCKVPRFFDIAEGNGHRLGLYKFLVTWPPRELEHGGFIVPAWLAKGPETQPPELSFIKEIELSARLKRQRVAARRSMRTLAWEGLAHGFRWSTVRDAALWSLRERVFRPDENTRFHELNLIRGAMDRDVFVHAMRTHRPALATFTYYATDELGHRFWDHHEPDAFTNVDRAAIARRGDPVADAYRQADAILYEAMRLLGPDARVVVVSDHGFRALDAAKDGIVTAPRTDALERRLKQDVGDVTITRVGNRITVGLLDADVAAAKARLEAWLPTVVVESTGKPLFRWQDAEGDAHAVTLDLVDNHLAPGQLDDDRVLGEPLSAWLKQMEGYSGDHDANGLFGAFGAGVTPGAKVDVGILDITPIILAGLGLPKGPDMPGNVPAGLWPAPPPRAESWDPLRANLRFPNQQATTSENEMLQMLGYVDAPTEPTEPTEPSPR